MRPYIIVFMCVCLCMHVLEGCLNCHLDAQEGADVEVNYVLSFFLFVLNGFH